MGAEESIPPLPFLERFEAAGLRVPQHTEYENDFEKNLFMAINLCRFDPKSFARVVYRVSLKNERGTRIGTSGLIDHLKKCPQLSQLTFLDIAVQACRDNNKIICENAQADPEKGGNIKQLKLIVGTGKLVSAEEFSQFNY